MALSLGRPTANTPALAAEVTQIIDLLEGAAGETLAFLLKAAATEDFIIRLSDAAGAQSLIVQDSAGATIASIDSNGNLSVAGGFDLSTGTLTLPSASTPVQTAEGSVVWDTDDDNITVGNGTALKRVGLIVGSGVSAAVKGELAYDTATGDFTLHDGSSEITIPTALTAAFKSLVETNAHKAVCWIGGAGTYNTVIVSGAPIGQGFSAVIGSGGSISGSASDGMWRFTTGATSNISVAFHGPNIVYNVGNWTVGGRFTFATPAAGISAQGLWAITQTTSVADVAEIIGWRSITTGAVFGVCDAGGTESTRDPSFTGDGATEKRLRIEILSTGTVVRFYMNDAQVGTDVTSNITTTSARGAAMGIRNNTTTSYVAEGSDMYAYREV